MSKKFPPASLSDLLFNVLQPLCEIDQTWLARLPHGDVCLKLIQNDAARPTLVTQLGGYYPWLTRELIDFDTQDWPAHILALRHDDLKLFVRYIGSWYFSQQIRHLIDAKSYRLSRKSLGEKCYVFATKKAPFLGLPSDGNNVTLRTTNAKQFLDNIEFSGLCLIVRELNFFPSEFSHKIVSKFPYSWYEKLEQMGVLKRAVIDRGESSNTIKKVYLECFSDA